MEGAMQEAGYHSGGKGCLQNGHSSFLVVHCLRQSVWKAWLHGVTTQDPTGPTSSSPKQMAQSGPAKHSTAFRAMTSKSDLMTCAHAQGLAVDRAQHASPTQSRKAKMSQKAAADTAATDAVLDREGMPLQFPVTALALSSTAW